MTEMEAIFKQALQDIIDSPRCAGCNSQEHAAKVLQQSIKPKSAVLQETPAPGAPRLFAAPE